MAPTQPRTGFAVKTSNFRSIITSRVQKNFHFQFFQFHLPADLFIVEQFRIHRDRQTAFFDVIVENEEDEKIRRRIFYIKEQKLDAISYVFTIWKIQKNESYKFINKHAAVKNLGITLAMLRH